MFSRRHRTIFGLNTTSTADISFVLLIFFLVTTSMNQDKGLTRQLPPLDPTEQPAAEVDSRDVLTLSLTAQNGLLANGEPIAKSEVKARVARFIDERGQHHVIALEVDPAAEYDAYFALQNQLIEVYAQQRNRRALLLYGKAYADCTPEQRDHLRQMCPQRIVENYPSQGGQPS